MPKPMATARAAPRGPMISSMEREVRVLSVTTTGGAPGGSGGPDDGGLGGLGGGGGGGVYAIVRLRAVGMGICMNNI